MSNYKNLLDKDLRKQKKLMREILCIKSKSYGELNDDQKAKLARENTVNRTINSLENKINRLNKPIITRAPVKHVQKKKNNKRNEKNKMTKSQLGAYKTHQELSKIEREEQKNKNMLRKKKMSEFRSIRQEQEASIGYLNMLMYFMMKCNMEQTEQAIQEAIQDAIQEATGLE